MWRVTNLTPMLVTILDNLLQPDGELLVSSVNKVVDLIIGSINITGLRNNDFIANASPFLFPQYSQSSCE